MELTNILEKNATTAAFRTYCRRVWNMIEYIWGEKTGNLLVTSHWR